MKKTALTLAFALASVPLAFTQTTSQASTGIPSVQTANSTDDQPAPEKGKKGKKKGKKKDDGTGTPAPPAI